MAASRKFLKRLIVKYQELQCLWKRTDPDYHHRARRSKAVDQLLQLFREKFPDANRDTVLKKINSLRGAFRKELNKVRVSEQFAASPDEIHVPKLWYYDLMIFLKDQEDPRQYKRAFPITDEKHFVDDEIDYEEFESEELTVMSRESTPVESEDSSIRTRSKASQVLDMIPNEMVQSLPNVTVHPISWRQKYHSFGQHISEKLRTLSPGQIPICQKLINDAIFYAEIGALNLSSKIVLTPSRDSH